MDLTNCVCPTCYAGGPLTAQIWKIMRLTTIFLFAVSLHLGASGHAQKVTISFKDAPLKKVFIELNRQTGYNFLYSDEVLAVSQKVTIRVKDASLEEVLRLCFKNQPLDYLLQNNAFVIKYKANAVIDFREPESFFIDIQGRVVNENGEPVPGATVTVKGTSTQTATDETGRFTILNVDGKSSLIISGVNIQTLEIVIEDRGTLEIKVKTKITNLSDLQIVSTGYQDIPKERATGSFSKADNKTINQQVTTSIMDRLDGVISGLLFDRNEARNGVGITVRGITSIFSDKSPLIIVDNFPYEGDINNINPNEIESVTVLKDAAAASIWGTRAGNGVIVITTKKGKFNQKLRVDVNYNTKITGKPDVFYSRMISSSDFIDVETMLYNKGFYNANISDTRYNRVLSPIVEILENQKKGFITQELAEAQINELRTVDVRNDFNKYMYQNGILQQYGFNMQGGTQTSNHSLSAGYDKSIGTRDERYNRINLRTNNNFKLSKSLLMSVGIALSNSVGKTGRPGLGDVTSNIGLEPYSRFADINGNPLPVIKGFRKSYIDTAGAGRLLDWQYFPLDDYKHITNTSNIQNIQTNLGIQYQLSKELFIDFKYTYEQEDIKRKLIQGLGSYYTRDLINRFTELDRTTGKIKHNIPVGAILDLENYLMKSHNGRAQINFNKNLDNHSIAALGGFEIRQKRTEGNESRQYGYDGNIMTYGKVDLINPYKHFVYGADMFIPDGSYFTEKLYRFVSWFGNAAYTYKNRYILSASARKDVSNIFGVNANEKGVPLWSAGLGWLISDEQFFHSASLNYLKFRATFGYSGNVDLTRSAVTTISYSSAAPFTNYPYGTISQYANPDLRWEKVRTVNLGLDFELFKKRISGSVEVYRKLGFDLFGSTRVDMTAGIGNTARINVAHMKSHGIDLDLHTVILNKNFTWNTSFLFSYNTDKITKYFTTNYGVSTGYVTNIKEGYSLYSVFSYKWGGLNDNGDPQGYNEDGNLDTDYKKLTGTKLSPEELVYSGPGRPPVFGSLKNSFGWKGLELSFNISYKLGHFGRKKTLDDYDLINNGRGHKDYEKRWIQPGDETKTSVPALIYPLNSSRNSFYASSEVNVIPASVMRLQFLNLSYSIDKLKYSRMPCQNITVFVNANNLGILWKANDEGIDPDLSGNYVLPTPKNCAIGIKIIL